MLLVVFVLVVGLFVVSFCCLFVVRLWVYVWLVCLELLECCVVVFVVSVVDCVMCHCSCVVAVMSSYVWFVRVIAVVNTYVPSEDHDAWSCLVVFVANCCNSVLL